MRISTTLGDFSIDVFSDAAREWLDAERTLLASRGVLPLPHRTGWTAAYPGRDHLFVVIRRASSGTVCEGFVVQLLTSRALPFHRVMRVERFGAATDPQVQRAALFSIAEIARRLPRVLRAHVEHFSIDEHVRREIAASAEALGFRRSATPRCSTQTLIVDLVPDESTVLAALPKKTRRDIRSAARHPVEVRPIVDQAYEPRLTALLDETLRRTGGVGDSPDWGALLRLTRDHPHAARLVGLVRTNMDGPDALLAFAFGRHHGDHAEYATAGSTRRSDLKLPMAYPLVWDLMCWAKRHGARYFDLGGVSDGHLEDGDPVGGISDFKRYFSQQRVAVGAEWIYEPNRLSAAAARMVSSTAASLRGIRGAVGRPRDVLASRLVSTRQLGTASPIADDGDGRSAMVATAREDVSHR